MPGSASSEVTTESEGEPPSSDEESRLQQNSDLGCGHILWLGGRRIEVNNDTPVEHAYPESAAALGFWPPERPRSPREGSAGPAAAASSSSLAEDWPGPNRLGDPAGPTGHGCGSSLTQSAPARAAPAKEDGAVVDLPEVGPASVGPIRHGRSTCACQHEPLTVPFTKKKKPRPPKHVRMDCKLQAKAAFEEMAGLSPEEAEQRVQSVRQDEKATDYALAVLRALYKSKVKVSQAGSSSSTSTQEECCACCGHPRPPALPAGAQSRAPPGESEEERCAPTPPAAAPLPDASGAGLRGSQHRTAPQCGNAPNANSVPPPRALRTVQEFSADRSAHSKVAGRLQASHARAERLCLQFQ